jgi:hypothetical protein
MGGSSSKTSDHDIFLCHSDKQTLEQTLKDKEIKLQECNNERSQLRSQAESTKRYIQETMDNRLNTYSKQIEQCKQKQKIIMETHLSETLESILSVGSLFRNLTKNTRVMVRNPSAGTWCVRGDQLAVCNEAQGTTFQFCVDPRVYDVDNGAVAIACQHVYPVDWINGQFLTVKDQGIGVVTGYPTQTQGAAWRLGAVSGPSGTLVTFFASQKPDQNNPWTLVWEGGEIRLTQLGMMRLVDEIQRRPGPMVLGWSVDVV